MAELSPRMYRFARHLTGRQDEAEDLVQETLLKVLPALGTIAQPAARSTYALRAVANGWKNRLRARSRSRIVAWFSGRGAGAEEEAPALDVADPAPTALERLASAERAQAVRRALAHLAPERRLVLLLRETEELSYEEIAEVVGVPVGTVRSRLARAREDLRQLLEGRL